MNENDAAIKRAVSTLNEVMRKLAAGVDKVAFEKEYRGRYVSPGVTVHQYVRELRLSDSLEERGDRISLKKQKPEMIPA